MSNVRKENLSIWLWIELFIKHWKYGHDYESSTVLTDPQYNIIAFFDRQTENIDRIEVDIPFYGDFIIANWKWIETNWKKIVYKPYDFEMARSVRKKKVKELKMDENNAKILWQEIKSTLDEYNKNYFINVLKTIWKK